MCVCIILCLSALLNWFEAARVQSAEATMYTKTPTKIIQFNMSSVDSVLAESIQQKHAEILKYGRISSKNIKYNTSAHYAANKRINE